MDKFLKGLGFVVKEHFPQTDNFSVPRTIYEKGNIKLQASDYYGWDIRDIYKDGKQQRITLGVHSNDSKEDFEEFKRRFKEVMKWLE